MQFRLKHIAIEGDGEPDIWETDEPNEGLAMMKAVTHVRSLDPPFRVGVLFRIATPGEPQPVAILCCNLVRRGGVVVREKCATIVCRDEATAREGSHGRIRCGRETLYAPALNGPKIGVKTL